MRKQKKDFSKPDSATGKEGVKDSSSAALASSNAAGVESASSSKAEDKPASSTTIEVPSISDLGLTKDSGHDDHAKGDHHRGGKFHGHKNFSHDSGKKGDFHKEEVKTEPVANKQTTKVEVLPATVTYKPFADRALNEIEAPSVLATTLLQPSSYNANVTDVIRTKDAEDVARAHTGWNPGDNAVVGNVVRWMNELCLIKNVFSFDIIKSLDGKRHIGYYTARERQMEVDIAEVNVNTGASIRGASNSGYPFSSRFGNSIAWRPYMPQQYDEIKQFPLQGFVYKPSNTFFGANGTHYHSVLQLLHGAIPDFLTGHAYTLPVPGFNYAITDDDVTQGRIAGELHDYRSIVGRLRILDGPFGTSYRLDDQVFGVPLHIDEVLDAMRVADTLNSRLVSNQYVFESNANLTQWAENILDPAAAINRGIVPDDYMTYPDLNCETYLFDMHNIYLKLLHNVQDRTYQTLTGQLAGMVLNEQAIWHMLIALEQMGTFFRILLHSIKVTWGYGGFVARKLGCLPYNDMVLRVMSPTRKMPLLSFLSFIGDIIKDLPYNKYVVDNFKVWFKATMLHKDGNPYDENNPVMSLRAIFSSIYDPLVVCPGATHANTMPQPLIEESRSMTALYNAMHPHDHNADTISNLVESRFGMYVKSNVTQSPIFVPHGCPLGDFLYHFQDEIFLGRAPTNLTRRGVLLELENQVRSSLSMILDPLNLTGFVFNFFDNPRAIGEMRTWLSNWHNMVRFVNDDLRKAGISCGSFYYDEKPEGLFDINAFYANEAVVTPGFEQHIISYIQQSPRFGGRLNNATDNGDVTINIGGVNQRLASIWVTGHRPIQQSNNMHQNALFNGLDPDDVTGNNFQNELHGNLPRVGFRYTSPVYPLDNGTVGDAMYNVATAWYTSEQSFYQRYHDRLGLIVMYDLAAGGDGERHAFTRMLNRWYSGNFMAVPYEHAGIDFDARYLDRYLIEHWWYPSIWNIPYYPRNARSRHYGTRIIPCYDYIGANMGITEFGGHSFTARENTSLGLGADYVERYGARVHGGAGIAPSLAVSTARVLYGAYNNTLTTEHQWAETDRVVGGFNFNGILLTREHKVSIFTVDNAQYMGLLVLAGGVNDLGAAIEHILSDNDGIPGWWYSKEFCTWFGLPLNTLGAVSTRASQAGGSIRFIEAYQMWPGLYTQLSGSDLDLSLNFANLASLCGRLRTMQVESECYPSSDGYGHDLTSHPGDIRSKEQGGASVPNYNGVMEQLMNGKE